MRHLTAAVPSVLIEPSRSQEQKATRRKPTRTFTVVLLLSTVLLVGSAAWCFEKRIPTRIPEDDIVLSQPGSFGKFGAFCEIHNDVNSPSFWWEAFDSGSGFAAYMDPAQCGESPYPFNITGVHFYLYAPDDWDFQWPVALRVNIREANGSDSCSGPQGIVCSEDFSIPSDSAWPVMMTLDMGNLCCVNQPFFLEIVYTQPRDPQHPHPSLVMDALSPPADTCDNWVLHSDGQYYEWFGFWAPPVPGDAIIRATGYTEIEDCYSQASCPEDSNDHGRCDTLYVEIFPADSVFSGSGHLARVPIYVTNDIWTSWDSIVGFILPLSYTHTNPSKTCSLSRYWNNTWFFGPPERSIFRHLPGEANVMMSFAEDFSGREWDYIDLDVFTAQPGEPVRFSLAMIATGNRDQRWPGGSRRLLATATFGLEDTMTVCIDTCFSPLWEDIKFYRSDGLPYVPRHTLPYCFSMAVARGDLNADGLIDIGDVVFLINFVLKDGPAPVPEWIGDVNGDTVVDIEDVYYLISYLFRGGPPPCES